MPINSPKDPIGVNELGTSFSFPSMENRAVRKRERIRRGLLMGFISELI